MSNYNVGDKFIIEIETVVKDEEVPFGLPVLYRIKGFNALVFDEFGLDKLQKYEEEKYPPSELFEFRQEAFNAVMQEAWELAKLIVNEVCDGGIPPKDIEKMFNCNNYNNVFSSFTPQETKAIIEAWQEKKNIKVGDVVEYDDISGVVLDFCSEDKFHVLTENGCVETWCFECVAKTDKHFNIPIIISQLGSVRR